MLRYEVEHPAFLTDFDGDEQLAPLADLFRRGNYREVRRRATALLEGELRPEQRDTIETLLLRLEPAPGVAVLVGAVGVLLVAVGIWHYLGGT